MKSITKVFIGIILLGLTACEKEEDYCELVRYQYLGNGERVEWSRKDWNVPDPETASVEYGQGVFYSRDLDGDGIPETYRDYIECNGEVTPLENDIPVDLPVIETEQIELGYGDNACTSTKFVFFVPKGETFETTDRLFSKYDGTVYTLPNEYSNGTLVRYWNGNRFTTTNSCN